mgnify:CR=1 FL=1
MCELPTLLICHVIDWTARKRKPHRKEQQQHSLVPSSCVTLTNIVPFVQHRVSYRKEARVVPKEAMEARKRHRG